MDEFIFILELIGTVAFASSGAMIAIEKKMDIFGVNVLGATTAVGGGIMRDIILGLTPPGAFSHPVYVLVAAGASAMDLDVVSDVDVDGLPDADGAGGALASGFAPSDLSGENGVFTGDGQELDRLIQYGEVDGTTHVASEDSVRDIGARDAFLSAHGFDSVPEGDEVHQVVPLSEGGADTPDNMILVSEADHAAITSAHAGFYGWRD